MSQIELIKKLSNAFGPSGFEEEVSHIIMEEMKDFHPTMDTLCNVRASLPNNQGNPVVMLDAHLDEVGLIVQAIRPNGTMDFLPLGGWSPTTLPSSKMRIKNKKGQLISSIVAAKPVHFMSQSEKNNPMDISQMVLDCGSTSAQETNDDFHIGIASAVVPDVTCEYNNTKGLFIGKAFDCRIGVAAMIETMKRLQNKNLDVDVVASFSTQEEVGERGIEANVRSLQPRVAICFEGCPADDTFMEPYKIQSAINKGPMLRHFDISMITHPRFQAYALDIAEQFHIPVQQSVRKGGGTNGGYIHKQNIPCIVIGIPVRYIHSSHGICSYYDYEQAVQLAVKICESMNDTIIASF